MLIFLIRKVILCLLISLVYRPTEAALTVVFKFYYYLHIQAYCSSIAGALSLQATLTGLGVGEETATPLAATLMWLLKDGSGMVASIAFAYWRGLVSQKEVV